MRRCAAYLSGVEIDLLGTRQKEAWELPLREEVMPETVSRHAEGATFHGDAAGDIDWQAAEHSPEFQQLVSRRRRFVVPALVFSMIWYFGFIVLAGYAPDFMGEKLFSDFTVGYALALSQFVLVWGLSWAYLRKADREFDPLAARAAQRAIDGGATDGDGRIAGRRFVREEAGARGEEVTPR
jgi:uncharacterized membrane protein (DUF485 family)